MRKKLIRRALLLLIFAVTITSTNIAYAFTDIPAEASYTDALNRLTALGIISRNDTGKFNPDNLLTREQFSKMMVVAAGLEDTAAALRGTTIFSDVQSNTMSSGYINVALDKGFITGMSDGKFHPNDNITFAQVCTVLVKALGYTDKDVPGQWPNNYIIKANALGLTKDINLNKNDGIKRWEAVIIFDRLLSTNIKKVNTADADKAFIDTTGAYTQYIILGDSTTSDALTKDQILTDKGILYNNTGSSFELGGAYNFVTKNGTIQKAYNETSVTNRISVMQAMGTKVSYKNAGIDETITLPDSITYYYNGSKLDVKNLSSVLQRDTSIVFTYNESKTGYNYAVIFDPIYSNAEIAKDFVPATKTLGSITFSDDTQIIRNNELIDITKIEAKDIVYQVTDVWGTNKYVVVIDNKIGGEITGVLPNSLAPKTLKIDGVSYDFSEDIDVSKIIGSNGAFAVGNDIIVSLDTNGKIVDVEYFGTEDNSNFAVVLSASSTIVKADNSSYNKIRYKAKLLLGNNITSEYYVNSDASSLKGKLVKYTFVDSETLSLTQTSTSPMGSMAVNKGDGTIGSYYVSSNVKIINIVNYDGDSDITASILNWNDLPNGTIPVGKIWYMNSSGAFGDINLIMTDDIFDQKNKAGIVKSIATKTLAGGGNSYQYEIMVDGKVYTYTQVLSGAATGSAYRFVMTSSGIKGMSDILFPGIKGTTIQAIDSRRIKVDGTIYFWKNDARIYYVDLNGGVSLKSITDSDILKSYSRIEIYYNNTTDKKVETVVIFE